MPAEEVDRKSGNKLHVWCCSNVKSIITMAMILSMLLCIVLIVMVNKWQYDNEQLAAGQACLDIAIVGGGVTGTYAAYSLATGLHGITAGKVGGDPVWRASANGTLRDARKRPLLTLFEARGELGGRMRSRTLDGRIVELGAEYFTEDHKRMLKVIRALKSLKMVPQEYSGEGKLQPLPAYTEETSYFVRNRHVTRVEPEVASSPAGGGGLRSSGITSLYGLDLEQQKLNNIEDIKRLLIERSIADVNLLNYNPLAAKTKEGIHIYKLGLHNILSRNGSHEALRLLIDSSTRRSLYENGNAAQLASMVTDHNNVNHRNAKKPGGDMRYTIEGGMQKLPKTLGTEFTSTNPLSNKILLNRKLACIKKTKHDTYKLVFRLTRTDSNGHLVDIQEFETVEARKVILALPKDALTSLKWDIFKSTKRRKSNRMSIRDALQSLHSVTALKVISTFRENPLRQINGLTFTDVITDTPLQRVTHLGRGEPMGSRGHASHVVRTADVEGAGVDYFKALLKLDYSKSAYEDKTQPEIVNYGTGSSGLLSSISSLLQAMSGSEKPPEPWKTEVGSWGVHKPDSAAWFRWRKGVNWSAARRVLRRPSPCHPGVHLVSNSWCGARCQLWAEGALAEVDNMLAEYFK